MTDLLVRKHAPDAAGVVLEVTPQSAGWDHVGFKVVELAAGQIARGGVSFAFRSPSDDAPVAPSLEIALTASAWTSKTTQS